MGAGVAIRPVSKEQDMLPDILVLYGSTDGHTAKVAAAIASTLRMEGAQVHLVNAARPGPDPRAEHYAGVIVAASVHAGGYQKAVRRWVAAHARELRAIPTGFASVCLGVLEKNPATDRELAEIKQRFLTATGWQPTMTRIVAGALPYTRYNWLKRWIMRRIAAKHHAGVDTSRDYEYTDWNDVKAFAREFLQHALAAMPIRKAG
jgi:menaquinone-dependent protoporphyrinogen oxidase